MATLPAVVSRNGVFISPTDATISVFNPAIYGAYGVYESIQVVHGIVFELQGHLKRLAHSASVIELRLPDQLDTLARWIDGVVMAGGQPDCTVRLFVVGANDDGESCAYIWTQPPTVYPPTYYEEGATAITFDAQRYLPQSKSLNALTSFTAQRKARSSGVHEALLHHAGFLTEGSNSNLFAVIDGEIVTPPESEVLSGVTRDVVLKLARAHEVVVRCAPLPLESLPAWQECFITSTSRHVMPLSTINGAQVGDGRPGPMTRRVSALFEAYFAEYTRAL